MAVSPNLDLGRPKMQRSTHMPVAAEGIDAQTPRARLIEAATHLFCRYGINATGIDAIIAEAGTAKTTLYKIFLSKDGLVEAVLEQEGRQWRSWFVSRVEESGRTGRKRLGSIFPVLREWFSDARFSGCPFINAIGEHDKNETALRKLTLQHKEQVLRSIEGWACDAGVRQPPAFAKQIGVLMDGAIVAAMVTKNPAVADHAGIAAKAILNQQLR